MAAGRIYWIDRCLGANIVPTALRDAGVAVRTYADLYPDDPKVQDADWIPEVAGRGVGDPDQGQEHSSTACRSSSTASGTGTVRLLVRGEHDWRSAGRLFASPWKTIDGVVSSKRAPLIVAVTRVNVQWLDGDDWRVAKHKR